MNTQDFINKLDKLRFVEYKDKTLRSIGGFEITHELELMGGALSMYPIQFRFRVKKNDTHIMSWGCSSNEENAIAGAWWQKKLYAMQDIEYNAKALDKARLTELFNESTK